jgi:hypothetical protein
MGADAWIEEFDLEGTLRHRSGLPDRLIEPLLPYASPPFRIDIEPWSAPGGAPSILTRKRTGRPCVEAPKTR